MMSAAIAAGPTPLNPWCEATFSLGRSPQRTSGVTSVKNPDEPKPATQVGHHARAAGHHLHSYRVGLLPILNRILERLRLQEFFHAYLPPKDRRCRIDPAIGLLVLLKNLLL